MLRVTMGFASGRYSWTESHYTNRFSVLPAATLYEPIASLVGARVLCLGAGAVLTRVRISEVPAARIVSDYLPPSIPSAGPYEGQKGNNAGSRGVQAAPSNYALSLFGNGGLGAQTRLYLAGCPQGIFAESAPNGLGWDFSSVPNMWIWLSSYIAVLVQEQFGWLTRTSDVLQQANGPLVTNAAYPGMVGITLTSNPWPNGFLTGTKCLVRGWRRLSTRSPGLTGVHALQAPVLIGGTQQAPTYTFFLLGTQNVQPTNFFANPGQLGPFTQSFVSYVSLIPDFATSRKRGASFERPRGRSSISA